MEFDKSRVFSSVNADELRAGDKVIVANTLGTLKRNVANNVKPLILLEVIDEDYDLRFEVNFNKGRYALAYLVERAENCTNCGGRFTCIRQKPEHPELTKCCNYKHYECSEYKPKTEKKEMCLNCKHYNKVNDFRDCTLVDNPTGACPHYEAEKKYRPFRDVDELIKVWLEKDSKWQKREITEPFIWVRYKDNKHIPQKGTLIRTFFEEAVSVDEKYLSLETLFNDYEFLDGTPCGVEE